LSGGRQPAAEAALVERDSGNHSDIQVTTCREKLIFRRLVEDVVDHLHRIDAAGTQRPKPVRRLPTVEAQAEGPNGAIFFQLARGFHPEFVRGPAVVPDVKLQQVDAVDAQSLSNGFRVVKHMLLGENILE
jgi:hypothetical protein